MLSNFFHLLSPVFKVFSASPAYAEELSEQEAIHDMRDLIYKQPGLTREELDEVIQERYDMKEAIEVAQSALDKLEDSLCVSEDGLYFTNEQERDSYYADLDLNENNSLDTEPFDQDVLSLISSEGAVTTQRLTNYLSSNWQGINEEDVIDSCSRLQDSGHIKPVGNDNSFFQLSEMPENDKKLLDFIQDQTAKGENTSIEKLEQGFLSQNPNLDSDEFNDIIAKLERMDLIQAIPSPSSPTYTYMPTQENLDNDLSQEVFNFIESSYKNGRDIRFASLQERFSEGNTAISPDEFSDIVKQLKTDGKIIDTPDFQKGFDVLLNSSRHLVSH